MSPRTLSQLLDLRSKLQELCRTDLYLLAKGVLGLTRMSPALHKQLAAQVQDPTHRRRLWLLPRDHFKTSVVTRAHSIQLYLQDPDIRILIAASTATNAVHHLRWIQAVFERNKLFQWIWPDRIPDFRNTKWSEAEALCPRRGNYGEATFEAIGVGGRVTSRHYNVLKLDDLVDENNINSPELVLQVADWHDYAVLGLLQSQVHGLVDVTGTRWSETDFYGGLLEHYYVTKRAAKEQGPDSKMHSIFPEEFPLDVLNAMEKDHPDKFACQFMNDPQASGSVAFRRADLRWYTQTAPQTYQLRNGPELKLEHLDTCVIIDPAISESRTAARTAFAVVGVDPANRKLLLEAYAKKGMNPKELVDQALLYAETYGCRAIAVETVAYQKALRFYLAEEMERRGKFYTIIELRPDSREKKDTRIRGLTPFFSRGEIYIRDDMTDFIKEYVSYPYGALCDLLDALAYGPRVWVRPDSTIARPDDDLKQRFQRGELDVSSYRYHLARRRAERQEDGVEMDEYEEEDDEVGVAEFLPY